MTRDVWWHKRLWWLGWSEHLGEIKRTVKFSSKSNHTTSLWRHRSFVPFLPGTLPGITPGKSKIDQGMVFILKEEPINFHLRGQPTFSDQNRESYADFTVDLRKNKKTKQKTKPHKFTPTPKPTYTSDAPRIGLNCILRVFMWPDRKTKYIFELSWAGDSSHVLKINRFITENNVTVISIRKDKIYLLHQCQH